MNLEIPKMWCERVNAGDLEGVLSLYEETALLLATFDAQPLDQPVQRRKYFETKPVLLTTGTRRASIRQPAFTHFFLRRTTSLFDNPLVLPLSFRLMRGP
jgi:hypothetical protein